jgi:acyl-CoA thioesterase-1
MQKNEKIVVFGDSIAKGLVPALKKRLAKKFTADEGYAFDVVNMGIPSETTREGLKRLDEVISVDPTSVVIVFGMNDWRKDVGPEEFQKNYDEILQRLSTTVANVVVCTISPDHNGPTYVHSQPDRKGPSPEIPKYNAIIKSVAREYNVKIADVGQYWERTFEKTHRGLEDAIHPNPDGYACLAEAIFPVLIRTQMLVLWQFNGRYAHCNYTCPYCYVATSVNKGMHFMHTMEKWEAAFNKHFGDRHTVFYFSYGEPMIAKNFYEVLDMVAANPKWEAKVTTNLSLPLDRLLETRLAKEGRLNINASFHPTQVSVEEFIANCDHVRAAGIEPSVVYVMYPPQIDDLEEKYMPALREKGYVVHIRAFRGLYGGKKYPGAYTKEQWNKTAKYMDDANLRYQLCEISGLGRLSIIGMNHILVDNYGKIEMCDSYVGDRSYGNVLDDTITLDLEPIPFPGLVPLAAVDDIADYVELGYSDLEGNNILSYARQGGVYKKDNGEIVYPFEDYDFNNPSLRAKATQVPDPWVKPSCFWMNARWFMVHFIYSFLIKKYGKYIWAWIMGKWRLAKKGKLSLKNFWHS